MTTVIRYYFLRLELESFSHVEEVMKMYSTSGSWPDVKLYIIVYLIKVNYKLKKKKSVFILIDYMI